MLRFAVQTSSENAATIDIAHAYLLAANDVALSGKIRLGKNGLECKPETRQAAAINLECELKDMGRLALSTCLLEQRDEPYALMLELARHRIKLFIAKCEDWQIWDHPAAADALSRWNEARLFFTAAMTTQDAGQADALSLKALIAGLKASEMLAVAQAQVGLHRRFGVKAGSKMILGVRVDPRVVPASGAASAQAFDLISIPLSWAQIERAPGKYDFSSVTPWFDWAAKSGKRILAGPVVDLRPEMVPPWIAQKRGDFGALRDGVWNFCGAVGRELAGKTGMWNIASGINDNGWWNLDLGQMVEISRRVVVGLRQARKGVPTLLEIPEPFGHRVASREGAITPRALVDALVTDGIHLDCLMIQLLVGEPGPAQLTRDLLELSSLLDSYRPLRKSIFVDLGAPSSPAATTAGYWRTPWSAKSQSVWASRMFSIAMSKSHVGMVLWESLMDVAPTASRNGAVDEKQIAKGVLKSIVSLRQSLAEPIGPWKPLDSPSPARTAATPIDAQGAPLDAPK
ncbi:MAG: hypothetical protein EXS01_06625 [Phycisphaerales bacterium]|nr:hypothetical protein [Phycisphaerales bacterium]